MNTTGKQTIFFDVDGVLINGYHYRPEKRICWDQNLERDLGIQSKDFVEKFIFEDFSNKVVLGQDSLYSALERFLPTINFHDTPQIVIDYWLRNDSHINYDLLEIIKSLKTNSDIVLYISTQQAHDRAIYLMENLGFSEYFSDIFHTARIGFKKTDPLYYEEISKLLNIQDTDPTPILFDDTPNVIKTAKECGWNAYEYYDILSLQQCPVMTKFI